MTFGQRSCDIKYYKMYVSNYRILVELALQSFFGPQLFTEVLICFLKIEVEWKITVVIIPIISKHAWGRVQYIQLCTCSKTVLSFGGMQECKLLQIIVRIWLGFCLQGLSPRFVFD